MKKVLTAQFAAGIVDIVVRRNHMPWISVEQLLPEDGRVVETKVEDENGCGNERQLKRDGRMWFDPRDSTYVYYTPTHWRPIA